MFPTGLFIIVRKEQPRRPAKWDLLTLLCYKPPLTPPCYLATLGSLQLPSTSLANFRPLHSSKYPILKRSAPLLCIDTPLILQISGLYHLTSFPLIIQTSMQCTHFTIFLPIVSAYFWVYLSVYCPIPPKS